MVVNYPVSNVMNISSLVTGVLRGCRSRGERIVIGDLRSSEPKKQNYEKMMEWKQRTDESGKRKGRMKVVRKKKDEKMKDRHKLSKETRKEGTTKRNEKKIRTDRNEENEVKEGKNCKMGR